MPEVVEKIGQCASLIQLQDRPIRLEVDGGISPANISLVSLAGADTFVSASAIFNNLKGIGHGVTALRKALK